MSRTATEIAAGVRRGEQSATAIAAAYLDRAETEQERLNAFTLIDRDGAEQRAAEIDRLVGAGIDPGPLAGVPVAVKDLIDQAGLPTTAGSSFLRGPAGTSAAVVTALEAAGAVIIGRTGLHEFAFGFSSENHWWGPVRNPWDPATSPGGSSGGSAAAVAAHLAVAALGTDTGGSVRVPAALCGVVGLKVTHGAVSTRGVFPLAGSLDTVGPLTRSVADARLVLSVIAGDDPADPWSRPAGVSPRWEGLDGLRVGVPVPWTEINTERAVRHGFQTVLDRLTEFGATVSEISIAELDRTFPLGDVFAPEVAAVHRHWFNERPDDYGPEVAVRISEALAVSPDAHVAAKQRQSALRAAVERAHASCDVLATPAVAARRKEIGVSTMRIDDKTAPYRPVLSAYSALVNQLGAPAVTLPLAEPVPEPGYPPVATQFIGPPWSEPFLLSLGEALEEADVVAVTPPPVPVEAPSPE